jgi:hypothetical protein
LHLFILASFAYIFTFAVCPSNGEKNYTSFEKVNHRCNYEKFVLKRDSIRAMPGSWEDYGR